MTGAACKRRSLSTWPTCDCPPCQATRYHLAKLARNGQFNRIPPERGMAALLQMMNAGMVASAIADATGIGEHTVSNWLAKLRAGKTFKLGAQACSLLVTAKVPENGMVGTTVPRRMLQALARIGWSCDELTRRIRANGRTIGTNTLHAIRSGRTQRVRAWVANEITALYRDLEITPGPSKQTVRLAVANGWAGTLAWDEDTILDPNARPVGTRDLHQATGDEIDEAAVLRRMAGDKQVYLTKADRAEVVRRMRAAGWSIQAIEDHTGIKADRYVRLQPQEAAA